MGTKSVILVSPKLGIGGIQRAVTNLANWFAESGFQVSLVSCKKENVFYKLNKQINIYVPDFEYQTNRLLLPLYYLRVILYLRKVFKTSKSNIIFSFGESFNPLSILASQGLNKFVYVSDRTSPEFKFRRYVKWLKKKTYPLSHGLICQTSHSKRWNEHYFNGKLNCHIIPNMVKMREPFSGTKENWILYMGRLSWEKGPERLLEVFSKMKNTNSFKLIICGNGPLEKVLVSKCKKLGLEDKVEFMGQVKDVDYYYSRAKIFVLPSYLEGFPNAMCEAMASGLPSICFEAIPYEDLGRPWEDFLVARDNEDFVSKLDQLVMEQGLREKLSVNGRNAMAKLSMDTIGKSYMNFYQKHVK